jgi:SAM-dependent methyltransferase
MAEEREPDPYRSGVCAWWHLSSPSPELTQALESGFFPREGAVLDLGSGLGTEAGHLARRGWRAVGVDLSAVPVRRAAAAHPTARFARADARRLPFRAGVFDAALDRGCFHYLSPEGRAAYAAELARVLRPGAPVLLRACLRAHGVRNDLRAEAIREVFRGWLIECLDESTIPSDTRRMDALVVRLRRP